MAVTQKDVDELHRIADTPIGQYNMIKGEKMKELVDSVEYGSKDDMEFLSIKTDLGRITFARHPQRTTPSCTIRKEDLKWHIIESCIGAKR